jgi:hypothetical protein
MVLAQIYNRNNSNSVTTGGPNFNLDVTKTNNNLMTLQAQLGKTNPKSISRTLP